ncbi:MAG: hypothetical protein AAB214_01575, partial [Fibrobacterota bacterium]
MRTTKSLRIRLPSPSTSSSSSRFSPGASLALVLKSPIAPIDKFWFDGHNAKASGPTPETTPEMVNSCLFVMDASG